MDLLAKIAVGAESAVARRRARGGRGTTESRRIAKGDGWIVDDVVCSCGPEDRPFDEQHNHVAIAIVISGTFQYRGSTLNRREMMTPGSLLLGNPGQSFECGHEHGVGDRCLSFRFTPEYFAAIADVTPRGRTLRARTGPFRSLRLPPMQALSGVIARASAALGQSADIGWEELGVRLAALAVQLDREAPPDRPAISSSALARVTRTVRMIDDQPVTDLGLNALARDAGLSPYHFLRTFQHVTGTTPHQYLLRMRLRAAAIGLVTTTAQIIDVALDAGFGDVSNFNRAFRSEFGMSPTAYRRQ